MDNSKILKAFNIVSDIFQESVKELSFEKLPYKDTDEEMSVIFQKESLAYGITYDKERYIYHLFSYTVAQNENNEYKYENQKEIVSWLFDPESASIRDAEDIGKDFARTVSTKKRKNLAKNVKKRKKSDDANIDPVFLFNRLVNVFPSIKEKIKLERESFEEFRSINFAKSCVLPEVEGIFTRGEKARIKKFCGILSNVYPNADLDTKGIITYIILNSVSKEEQIALCDAFLSDELKKAWSFSRKLIGKNLKPEKPKKPKKSFIGSTLSNG